ncbi:MAG: hypothetical protein ACFCD0_09910, partial [Gemmataceae bacterium]
VVGSTSVVFSIFNPAGAKDPSRGWEPPELKVPEQSRLLFIRPPLRKKAPNPSEARIIASEAGKAAVEGFLA